MPRKLKPETEARRQRDKTAASSGHSAKAAAAAVSAADKRNRAPKVKFVAPPPADSEAAQEYIQRIRDAQDAIHKDCLFQPLPPSAEFIDELGRSRFRAEYYELVFNYCLLGATMDEVAMFLGIPRQTIDHWAVDDELFNSAVKSGREQADARVAGSIYRRALGYSHPAVKIFCDKEGSVTEVPYVQHYPPDSTAAMFWLKNRQPEKWKEKVSTEHSGPGGRPIEVEHVRTALLGRLARLADANAAGRSDLDSQPGGDGGDLPGSDGPVKK